MPILDIKPTHKQIKQYYAALADFEKQGVKKETSVRAAFQELLTFYARKLGWTFTPEPPVKLTNGNTGSVDGVVRDQYTVSMGWWEAKDTDDDLKKEIAHKFEIGYPKSNILFQSPHKAVLYQDGGFVSDYDLTEAANLCRCLTDFFGYKSDDQEEWGDIVEQFKQRIPENAKQLVEMIEEEKKTNKRFQSAFTSFAELCRASINPNLADAAIEEMLVQHILTSRIFETVFDNPEFVRRNVIAVEIEKVIDALTSQRFNRKEFYKRLDHFYVALERRAKSITDWSQKQSFLNTVYEKFFQGFAVKVADTYGIVYTPQPIVDFMVRSVQHILKTEFGRSLADEGVHILDPFVGTGNFMMRVMKEIAATQKTKLPKKYANELHCNEVMLLPYYIASMNIEHEYWQQTGEYKSFEGICLVDTFELAEPAQTSLFTTENSERVERQKKSPIFVIIGNPPYNAGQVNENDNNKNRKYPVVDRRIGESYAAKSKATLLRKLSDPYVKAFRFASDRLQGDGIVAFVTNSSFLSDVSFDGMRKSLCSEFDSLYIIDLGGNVKKNPKLSGTTHNVFGIQVGVSINILVRRATRSAGGTVHYARTPEFSKKEEKYEFLNVHGSVSGTRFEPLAPDANGNWLETGGSEEYDKWIAVGFKTGNSTESIFSDFSLGVSTNRDYVVYDYDVDALTERMTKFVEDYNAEVQRYAGRGKPGDVDGFVNYEKIQWSDTLKNYLRRGALGEFDASQIRGSLYRPFTTRALYYSKIAVDRPGHFSTILPNTSAGAENTMICLTAVGNPKPFHCIVTNCLPDLHLTADSQCFPFYTYDEDGSNRKENITDWALEEFRGKLAAFDGAGAKQKKLTKWDIFYYVYGLLHHPEYRTKYAANLRRELPRIPVSPDFWAISAAGKKLADLHVNYEQQKEYPLVQTWREGSGLNLRVEKMKLTKDKRSIVYNRDLTLEGIPPEVFEYRLGNRSALDWIIDQYQVSTDKRSGITNDPNRDDEPEYIIGLIGKVITVSLETVKLVNEIAGLRMGG